VEGGHASAAVAKDGQDVPFEDLLRLTKRGKDWQMWDRMSPLTHESITTCELAPFRPAGNPSFTEGRMCLYPEDQDIHVSRQIKHEGRWHDCDALVSMWNDRTSSTTNEDIHSSIYLELGTNIGACLLEMLFSTDAFIVAFEPDPRNLAQLTTTLMVNDVKYRNRVALFPLGLSDQSGRSSIHQAVNNRANAVVGQSVQDEGTQEFLDGIPISLERLDHVFEEVDLEKLTIPVVKMDVQGFECRVLYGGKRVFGIAKSIKTEMAEKWLEGAGCSGDGLLQRIHDLNFNITGNEGDVQKAVFDIIASKL
jgi:FkbM family methyltransferase